MRRRWRIVIGLLALIALGVIAIRLFETREPSYQGKKLTTWLEELRSGHPETRVKGAMAIRQIGTNALPILFRELHAHDSKLKRKVIDFLLGPAGFKFDYRWDFQRREDALRGFAALGPAAKPAIPEIRKLLSDGEYSDAAAYALSQMGRDALPALKSGLANTNWEVRSHAVGFLGQQKGKSDDVVPTLLKALGDPDFLVRSRAVRALTRFPDKADVIVPALIACLDDSDETLRSNAARALGSFGTKALPAVPKLMKMVEVEDSNGSLIAARVLLKLDPEKTITLFTNKLQSPDVNVRRKTALALMSWKSNAAPAIPALIVGLKDEDKEVKINAAVALREIGCEPDLVVPALMENLKDPDLKVRSITAIALCEFGERAKPAVPVLIKLIEENQTDHFTAESIWMALDKVDPEAAENLNKKQ